MLVGRYQQLGLMRVGSGTANLVGDAAGALSISNGAGDQRRLVIRLYALCLVSCERDEQKYKNRILACHYILLVINFEVFCSLSKS